MGRAVFKVRNCLSQMIQIMTLIEQSCPKANLLAGRGVHALAEPKRGGVIFPGVVDRFERLRTDALHVPQMEEFVCGDAGEMLEVAGKLFLVQADCRAVSVFHATAAWRVGGMIDEHVSLKGTIIHPLRSG